METETMTNATTPQSNGTDPQGRLQRLVQHFPADRLRRPGRGIETLERLKRWPQLRRHLLDQAVFIYSAEHRAYWCENGAGYTTNRAEAGMYTVDDAIARTWHCGPEKMIEYHSLF